MQYYAIMKKRLKNFFLILTSFKLESKSKQQDKILKKNKEQGFDFDLKSQELKTQKKNSTIVGKKMDLGARVEQKEHKN